MSEKEIQKSLESARLVQTGLLPKKRHLDRVLKEYFLFYEPKDIVSGDFYWVGTKHGLNYLVVGDCTGHGISASLLSVLGLNLFEYVIMNKGIKKVSKILQEVDKKFIESFSKESNPFDNPWIDLSIICIDRKTRRLHYASANRKMLVVDAKQEPTIYKGSRYPIGGWQIEDERKFSTQTFSYTPGTTIYLGSDGFQDQVGGFKYKKYKSKQLHHFLTEISQNPLNEQRNIVEEQFEQWKGSTEQTDDVCLLGLRL